jgi:DNA polymerase-3 subunit gamma/tau
MSYIVFARKWRPQSFDEIVGQDNAVKTLKNAVSSSRLAHAYIFAGPRGVGKTSTARILAKSLNCQNGPTLRPCNKCPACIEITESRSLDVIEIDGASNRGIDDIRTLRENVKFSPAHGKFKIYIIDEVHQITSEGFNALLKTLEEPPPHVKFIFATTHPQKIPSTILSRCQFLDFKRITNVKIIQQLKHIALSEKLKVGEDVFLAIAKASDGSLRDAESVLDELVSFTHGEIKLQDVNSVMGVVEQEFLFELTDTFIKKDAPGALSLLDKLLDEGKDANQLLLNLIEHYRNLMVTKVTRLNQEKLLDLPLEVCERIAAQSREISLDAIFLGFNTFLSAQEMAKRIENLRIPLEIALIKLSAPKSQVSSAQDASGQPVKEDTQKISHQHSKTESEAVSKETHMRYVHERHEHEESAVALERVKELWPEFMEKLNKIKVSAAHYLEEGAPVGTSGNVLTIGFPQGASFHREALERKENLLLLEKIWKDMLGHSLKIHFSVTQDIERPRPAQQGADSLLQSVLDTFKGRVVKKG